MIINDIYIDESKVNIILYHFISQQQALSRDFHGTNAAEVFQRHELSRRSQQRFESEFNEYLNKFLNNKETSF